MDIFLFFALKSYTSMYVSERNYVVNYVTFENKVDQKFSKYVRNGYEQAKYKYVPNLKTVINKNTSPCCK